MTSKEALALAKEVNAAGLKNGVVQDKLWLPGLLRLRYLIDTGFFGKILSVRGERSASGCSPENSRNCNAPPGTTARKTTVESSSTSFAIGST
jgi:predicted dehydrogenase